MKEDKKNYSLTSDEGKLHLAGKDIYQYENNRRISQGDLEDIYEAKIIDHYSDPASGFSGYALKDNKTGEIVIVYVGTQPKQEGKGDIKTDVAIGLHNLAGINFLSVKQIDQADAFYQQVKQKANGAKISLTGHSLGGGEANSVAMRNQEDHLDVLTLNPAPLLNSDVVKYGYGFDNKNIRNVINDCDPLHIGVKSADMVIPGQMYKIPNGKGHSYGFVTTDFNKDGSLIWFDKLKSDNDTGLDWFPGYYELTSATGDVYKGLRGDEVSEEMVINLSVIINSAQKGIAPIVGALLTIGDISALGTKMEQSDEGLKAILLFDELAVNLIRIEGANAVAYIENSLMNMKERINESLEGAFYTAFQDFKGNVAINLTVSEILSILKDIGLSYLKEIMDIFRGDYVVDAHIEQIIISHIISKYPTYKKLFLADSNKGINKALMDDIIHDIHKLSKDITQLEDDVQSAVASMIEKDEELKDKLFNFIVA